LFAANSPIAKGKSKRAPSFRKSDGAIETVIAPRGMGSLEDRMAERTRSRLSLTEVCGRPTTAYPGSPVRICVSISTGSASTPTTAALQALDNMAFEE
jgi:hypothetical protein